MFPYTQASRVLTILCCSLEFLIALHARASSSLDPYFLLRAVVRDAVYGLGLLYIRGGGLADIGDWIKEF